MKAMVCEMCGSNDLIKEEGVFVCQHCGTRYSVEEARSLMINGTVDVKGTVKVDNSSLVEKYLLNARRAKEKEDWEETEKYYNLVEQNDPNNIEAIFYSSYGKAKSSLIEADLYKREAAFKVLTNCVGLLDDNYNVDKESEEKEIIIQISDDIFDMVSGEFVYNTEENGYGITVSSDKNETITLFNTLGLEFVNSLEHIISKYPEGNNRTVDFYDLAIEHCEYILENGNLSNPNIVSNRVMELHKSWNKVDASHEVPDLAPEAPKKAGCYIATSVYGSYDCPEVWTLRRYRDYTLAKKWYGRAFIQIYYAISPTLVKLFGDTIWFKQMWLGKLNSMVYNLQRKGYKSTPYEDHKW